MNIHAYLLCFNEQDIIAKVLKYYSAFCTRIFLLDNYSSDNSVEIAKGFDKVKVIQWWSGNHFDDYKNIAIKQNCYKTYSRSKGSQCEEPADWVITCDMDELIYHHRLQEVLDGYKEIGVTVANIIGFNMVSILEPQDISCLVTEVRSGVQAKVFNKPVVFDPSFDMIFSPGCHPKGMGYLKMQQQPGYKLGSEPLALLHYKYLGARYINKAQQNNQRLSARNKRNQLGIHYQASEIELLEQNQRMRIKAKEVITNKGEIIFK